MSFGALDKTVGDLRNDNGIMGGAVILLSGDFPQTLPVISRATPEDELNACFKASELWQYVQRKTLTTNIDDYRELIELSVVFLGGDAEQKFKSRPPDAKHQTRWMAQAIYSLKLSLFSSQLKLNTKDKEALLDVCLFIVTIYVKPWRQCNLTVKAPYKDLGFLKSLKAYENVNENISKAALQKFTQHLWYFTDEIAVLALFDDDVDEETRLQIVANLYRENFSAHEKRYIPSKEQLCGSLYDEFDTMIL
ncbi:hypothetical protein AVEN_235590-1 [Araneus ventricosus]|uniref:ATP-dependent DNA helicase n=1 Tax=Araneus ventricosus TaxID=182803 RepID=A0A4Y2BR10_ARAVE|nr:hypothetical protein AVEN_235590-1 [Araneus ventricosus]